MGRVSPLFRQCWWCRAWDESQIRVDVIHMDHVGIDDACWGCWAMPLNLHAESSVERGHGHYGSIMWGIEG